DALAAVAVEVFGEDRVQVEPRLPDALEAAITLAEEEGEFAGGGVLVTGSVITVGEARLLLGRGWGPVRTLCASPLIGEYFIIGFAGLVAMKDADLSTGTVWTVCGIAMFLCVA